MKTIPLTITARCKENPNCFFTGKNMPISIAIKNNESHDIDFPLLFVQKKGPSIKLIDTKTNRRVGLNTNLPDNKFRNTFTKIPPGESVSIDWIIYESELKQFGVDRVDLTAEISISTEIIQTGRKDNFKLSGVGIIKIIEEE
ncbi:hypothetical protein AAKU55_003296 [Oxalobacteraceae bacterium GrIS 1.11]